RSTTNRLPTRMSQKTSTLTACCAEFTVTPSRTLVDQRSTCLVQAFRFHGLLKQPKYWPMTGASRLMFGRLLAGTNCAAMQKPQNANGLQIQMPNLGFHTSLR